LIKLLCKKEQKMKKYLVIVAAAVLTVGAAEARIGWSLEQCRRYYGPEVKAEPAWCGGTAYAFVHDDLYIYVILGWGGIVGDITYFDNRKAQPLSQNVRDRLWSMNTEGRAWENAQYPGWDGKHAVKKLGAEAFPHSFICELNGPTVVIENAKDNGYQIRTMWQFLAEQKVIKAARAAAAGKAKSAPGSS
jgi:hypothetical protein